MTDDTILLIAGTIVTAMTLAAYWFLWPQQGRSHPLLRGRYGQLIVVMLVTGLVLGSGMMFAGLVPG